MQDSSSALDDDPLPHWYHIDVSQNRLEPSFVTVWLGMGNPMFSSMVLTVEPEGALLCSCLYAVVQYLLLHH